jgi:hypothetical protein
VENIKAIKGRAGNTRLALYRVTSQQCGYTIKPLSKFIRWSPGKDSSNKSLLKTIYKQAIMAFGKYMSRQKRANHHKIDKTSEARSAQDFFLKSQMTAWFGGGMYACLYLPLR